MKFCFIHLFFFSCFACSPSTPASPQKPTIAESDAPARWHYSIAIDADLRELRSQLCFDGPAPERLVANEGALDHLRWAHDATGAPLPQDGGDLDTSALRPNTCIQYVVDLQGLSRSGSRFFSRASERAVLADPFMWLWHPIAPSSDCHATLRFELPAGVEASVPWPREESDQGTLYHLDATAFTWGSQTAFGRFEAMRFRAAEADFEVVSFDDSKASQAGIQAWIQGAAEVVAQLYGGRFPREHVQVIVVPVEGGRSDPVYFGLTTRGGGAGVLLLLNRNADDEDLPGEWVAIHEFLHLGMPFLRRRDAWMSEGFVTYYTEVLRARAQVFPSRLLPPAQPDRGTHQRSANERHMLAALDRFASGFDRGRGEKGDPPLSAVSEDMQQSRGYQRVYWGGAAIALAVDLHLRKSSGDRHSLDDLMRLLRDCCANSDRVWRADALLEKMSTASKPWGVASEVGSIAEIAAQYLDQEFLPPTNELLSPLAHLHENGDIGLLDPSSDPGIRSRAIFAPLGGKLPPDRTTMHPKRGANP